jgi:hypothetical protein
MASIHLHAHVEVRRNHRWVKIDDIFPNPIYDPKHWWSEWTTLFTDHPPQNGVLHAVLAAERNSDGAASPIPSFRGLPADVTLEVRQQFAKPDPWSRTIKSRHSVSWLSLRELLQYEWATLPSEDRYEVAEFCGATMPKLVRILFEPHGSSTGDEIMAFINCWQQGDGVAILALGDWLEERCLPRLDDLRLIYWFD